MNQLPDELFRKRIENLSTPPPTSAWTRIEGGMRRHQTGRWLKIAAAVLLLITASVLIWSVRHRDTQVPLVAGKDPVPQQEKLPQPADMVQPPIETENEPVAEIAAKETPRSNAATNVPSRSSERDPATEAPVVSDKETIASIEGESLREEAATTIGVELPPTSGYVAEDQPEVASYKLVLEADEVRAKYLRKNSVADATDDKTKTSGLKKLLDKAGDLKNNQDPIGDLRQMKDDLFALNFKKRDQNKR